MPNIKPEARRKSDIIVSSKWAEDLLTATLGAVFCSGAITVYTAIILYISDLFHPFTLPYLPLMPHKYLPLNLTDISPISAAIIGAITVPIIYRAEKNIYFRRIRLIVRCLLISASSTLAMILFELACMATKNEHFVTVSLLSPIDEKLPYAMVLLLLTSAVILKLCDTVRRYVFHLP